jgi:hypothetical protein
MRKKRNPIYNTIKSRCFWVVFKKIESGSVGILLSLDVF